MYTTLLLAALLVAVVALGLVQYAWRRRRLYRLSWQLPGPPSLPFVGAIHLLLNAPKVLDNVRRLSDKYGDLFGLWLGPQLAVYVQCPDAIERILAARQCAAKGDSYRHALEFLGNGLITLHGDAWRRHRKLLKPVFSRRVVDQFAGAIDRHVRHCVLRLAARCKETGPEEFDVLESMQRLSMDLICETTMDRQMNTQAGGNGPFLSAIRSVHEIAANRIFNPLMRPDWLFRWTEMYERQQHSIRLVHRIVEDIIERKSGEIEAEKRLAVSSDALWQRDLEAKPIFIDRALRSRIKEPELSKLSAVEVRDETNTILVAGYETTAIEMSFLLLMLAMHPRCQDRVYEECKSVYIPEQVGHPQQPEENNNSSSVTVSDNADALLPADLELLTYLDMCISETLRLFPAGPIMTRKTSADVVIGDYIVPSGVEMLISHIGVNRSAKHWQHPDRFYPEHFMPEAVRERHRYAYLPFSAGGRSCLGQRYAKNVMRTTAVHIVRTFQLTTSLRMTDLRTRWNVSLCLINGHMIGLKRR